ncbi:unnamed protein product [Mytilus coruscus]|uniref:C2H2-type domain-containing protein n=1 Tax=Mytilus coruscus TaxID=42192 RepID=A0A6J8DKM6_MYTCO|nr:unnamed protein product [Mytilus coruscus]
MTNDSPVTPLGSLSVPLKLIDQLIYQNMVITDIEIPAVLGYDFMSNNHCIMDINNQTILINDQTVICKIERQSPNLFRITAEKDITIPAMSEMIIHGKPVQNTLKDALRGNTWFSTIDLVSGYYQCAMDPIDVSKTAFVTFKGLFQFNRMPFGLSDTGATYERLMAKVLAGLRWETCIVYLDDIIVFSQKFDEHVIRIRVVWEDQCDECGKRFHNQHKLTEHELPMHGSRLNCNYLQCGWSCSRYDAYRLRNHQMKRHQNRTFTPAETPRPTTILPSVVCGKPTATVSMPPTWNQTTKKKSLNLLSKFLEPVSANPSPPVANLSPNLVPTKLYSPTDPPFLNSKKDCMDDNQPLDLSTPSTSVRQPSLPSTPEKATTDLTQPISPSESISLSEPRQPVPQPDFTDLSEVVMNIPLDLSGKTSLLLKPLVSLEPRPQTSEEIPSLIIDVDQPLDLTIENTRITKADLSDDNNNIIDCTKPTGVWILKPIDIKNTARYEEQCLDPRLFLAGAPLSYMLHPLANSLRESIHYAAVIRSLVTRND